MRDHVPAARAAVRLSKICEIALREVDLSDTQYRLLVYLGEGSAPAAALAERLIVSRPSVTALVDGLVERGLVERVHDVDDRRRVNHVLTAAGRTALERGDVAVVELLETVAGRLGPVDAKQVLIGLELLQVALDDALAEREGARAAESAATTEVTA